MDRAPVCFDSWGPKDSDMTGADWAELNWRHLCLVHIYGWNCWVMCIFKISGTWILQVVATVYMPQTIFGFLSFTFLAVLVEIWWHHCFIFHFFNVWDWTLFPIFIGKVDILFYEKTLPVPPKWVKKNSVGHYSVQL